MPSFSDRSKLILETCHPKLIALCNTAIMKFDFSVISGHRGEEEQNLLLSAKKSHLGFPHSKHNREPSEAVDLMPYPMIGDWNTVDNIKRFVLLGGYMIGISEALQIDIRWGGDWSGDFIMTDQRFHDLPHIELI